MKSVSAGAVERYIEDKQRFGPKAYEEHNLAWKAEEWRTLNPNERAAIHCLPSRMLDTLPAGQCSSAQHRAKKNSLIGNGIHLPSLLIFFSLILQMARSTANPSTILAYSPEEKTLRERMGARC